MQAVILAAGKGTRMPEITKDKPKCLIEIAGKTIIERQIEILRKYGVKDIYVVIGYKAEQVKKKIYGKAILIYNPIYELTDNIYSLYLSKDFVVGKEFILLNGDAIFDEEIISMLVDAKEKNIAPIDSKYYDLEELKIKEKDGLIEKILSKDTNKEESDGSTIGIFKFSSEGSRILFEEVENCIKKGIKNKWFEHALNNILPKIKMQKIDIHGYRWVEIDTLEDIEKAERLFGE